ncbi:MAG: ribosome small subunit-dependent GTPase A [Bdellovibrio sp. CG12_big_fil_rev_8_21_14_0_65_39_13]|nr:MAG: ribosome small subunit-dependent GTPase A [Bdellovibrio sp. CG22_combo_CG10-13_8_21_14_all_39_27]PIQ58423.1 MAG: ribosome small subunit-dependent GTPase A [Bdellovibrio sp. CG12_big_fil_rev_8_21_14_0_65_39_13]PIR35376.1 MAG: ribosome small subunit-dependent GTPase A [Bdellovibrio sp. CG11_big_fil_rev_8_21_14_0_20_39_38]
MRARVYKSHQKYLTCKILETGEIVSAVALGNLLKNDSSVVVGDYVNVEKMQDGDEWQINQVEERSSEIFRIFVRESRKKVTAANVDALVIVMSLTRPAFKRGILDRYLIRASQWELKPIVIFNKMDEFEPQGDFDIVFEAERLKGIGAQVYEISAIKKEAYLPRFLPQGYDQLIEALVGKTAAFVGQSGVGKSETISALSGGEITLKTQEVGKVGKGQHTTTWSELAECSKFALIDSPGIRSFSVEDILASDLIHYFPDIEEVSLKCKFTNCKHQENSQGCAFVLEADQKNREALFSRLESYQRIREELGEVSDWQKKF